MCMVMEIGGIRYGMPRKDGGIVCVKNNMKSFGLSHKDAHSKDEWRIKGATG